MNLPLRARLAGLLVPFLLAGCGDATVLTGPDAEAAVARAQARVEATGELQVRGLEAGDDRMPVVFIDGVRTTDDPTAVLRRIRPEDIERIEVVKRCDAVALLGDDAWAGIIAIFSKSHDGDGLDLERDEDRYWACRDSTSLTPRWLHEAQQRHVRR